MATSAQVDCETVHRWVLKNSAESENLNWILAHTKQCPKCKRPIEKNQGCMHMTCSQCRYAWTYHLLCPTIGPCAPPRSCFCDVMGSRSIFQRAR